jgi:hypothetical protein
MKCYAVIKKNELNLQLLMWKNINGLLFVKKVNYKEMQGSG